MKKIGLFVIAAAFGTCSYTGMAVSQEASSAAYIKGDIAAIRAMDKVTGRVSTATLKVGQQARFGTLAIRLAGCVYMPPEETPADAALLEITDRNKKDGTAVPVFSGWMFAASPALSAMEHSVYDIWVLSCGSAKVVTVSDENYQDPEPSVTTPAPAAIPAAVAEEDQSGGA